MPAGFLSAEEKDEFVNNTVTKLWINAAAMGT